MEVNSLLIHVEYKFSSCISRSEVSDCFREYTASLYAGDYTENSLNEYAGAIDFKIINLIQAETEGFNIYELFVTYEYTYRLEQNFYDFKNRTLKKPIINEFADLKFGCNNLCIQKKKPLTNLEEKHLKSKKLIEGRKPNYFIGKR